MNTFFQKNNNKVRTRGFVLPLTLIVCVIILTIATGISVILAKELYFSKLSRLSQVAYYAADSGLMCATMIDDKYIDPETGLGIFEYNNLVTSQSVLDKINISRIANGQSAITLADIKCATSDIFDETATSFAVTAFTRTDAAGNPDNGQTSTFNMRMDLDGGEYRCATVVINKTSKYRQIISRGFASCNSVFAYPIERAIVSTAESADIEISPDPDPTPDPTPPSNTTVLTSGTSWVVPDGVTQIKIWAVGAGGGGAGANGVDATAGGGGGAGGLVYGVADVTPGQIFSYNLGPAGVGSTGGVNGGLGGDTFISSGSLSLSAYGGTGGKHNTGAPGSGGAATGGLGWLSIGSATGGTGYGPVGDVGGGAGGGTALANASANGAEGGTGAQANDISGLFAALVEAGYPTTAPGAGSLVTGTQNAMSGSSATGVGSGGGGAANQGGNGGDGLFGGGGGGAAGYSANNMKGGDGGQGFIVITIQ